MSKAFTSEDQAREEALVRAAPRAAPGRRRYITPEGFRALEEELARVVAARPDDPRASLLRQTLAAVTVAAPEPQGRVVFGARVVLEDEDGGTREYRVVGPDEADAKSGLVSSESPLGRALIGREEGDAVSVERPRGTAEYTVLRILPLRKP